MYIVAGDRRGSRGDYSGHRGQVRRGLVVCQVGVQEAKAGCGLARRDDRERREERFAARGDNQGSGCRDR